jgi:enoyl-CoA hydratase/carnithine racemase
MEFRYLEVTIADGIARVKLNRPERRNALSLELMRELILCLDGLAEQSDVHAVILAAAGRVFCSGHDLGEMTGRSEADYAEIFSTCTQMMARVQSIPQPVIAEVQGMATAAGCQLVATCDLAIAAEDAQFATPGVKIGLFCTTPAVALVRAIGRKRALEMLLTGTPISAQTAAEWGLINQAVPAAELSAETHRLAARIASASGFVVGLGKRAFYEQLDRPQPDAYACAEQVMRRNALAGDAQEGITAFLEKRAPQWRGE